MTDRTAVMVRWHAAQARVGAARAELAAAVAAEREAAEKVRAVYRAEHPEEFEEGSHE